MRLSGNGDGLARRRSGRAAILKYSDAKYSDAKYSDDLRLFFPATYPNIKEDRMLNIGGAMAKVKL